jgi:hypothetical protein
VVEMDEKLTVELDKAEALVLFDWLSETANLAKPIVKPEVNAVLNSLLCELERLLVEPFDERYEEIIGEARAEIIRRFGT